MIHSSPVHVAVGVIVNSNGEILIAKRADYSHQGGKWEFPGGKLEPGETPYQALERELQEELEIQVVSAQPLIQIRHRYSDREVLLDVWITDRFRGEAKGLEGQPIRWIAADDLNPLEFPEANHSIITATRLPRSYPILEMKSSNVNGLNRTPRLLEKLRQLNAEGHRLVRLRGTGADPKQLRQLIRDAKLATDIKFMVDLENAKLIEKDVAGIHLTGRELMNATKREHPFGSDFYIAASCHNIMELKKAERVGIDFVLLSPVLKTQSHPCAKPLGWKNFSRLASEVNLPVFALGGLTPKHNEIAIANGAQGISGISMFGMDAG